MAFLVRSPAEAAPSLVAATGGISDALIALGLVFSGASQFRLGGLPVGPGEACLFAWIAMNFAKCVRAPGWSLQQPLKVMTGFWTIFVLAQCLGLLTALATNDEISWPLVAHDIVAFSLMSLITIIILSSSDCALHLRRIALAITLFGSISLSLQIASGWELLNPIDINPWYWDRFRGWSDNPNQLSLFCAILVPISLYAAAVSRHRLELFPAIFCAAASFTAGFMTKGNTFRLSLAVGLLVALLVSSIRSLHQERPLAGLRVSCILLAFAGTPLLAASFAPLLGTVRTEDLAKEISRDQDETLDEAALRFELWGKAIQCGFDSYFLGLGPGSHVPVPAIIVLRQNWETNATEEQLGAVAKHGRTMESHNSYFELFSQGGLLLIIAYLGLLIFSIRHILRIQSYSLLVLFSIIIIFGIFHVILRHPIVWFGLCLCLAAEHQTDEPRYRRTML